MNTRTHLTMPELEAKYSGEWVLLDEPEVAADGDVRGGVLIAHSADADVIWAEARQLDSDDLAVYFLGEPAWTGAIALGLGSRSN